MTMLPKWIFLLFVFLCVFLPYVTSLSGWYKAAWRRRKLKQKKDGKKRIQKVKSQEKIIDIITKSYQLIMKSAKTPGFSAYIGCFTEDPDWYLGYVKEVETPKIKDVVRCIKECWELRQRFAMLKNGNRCLCSTLVRGLTKTEDSKCFIPCSTNKTQICGGKNISSVYCTGYVSEPQFTQITYEDLPKLYEGCYADPSYSTLCPHSVYSSRLQVPMCMALCEDSLYQYAALDTPVKCCCAKTLKGVYRVQKTMCPLHCKGRSKKDESCGGGDGYLAVYETGVSKLVEDNSPPEPTHIWMQANINETDIRLV